MRSLQIHLQGAPGFVNANSIIKSSLHTRFRVRGHGSPSVFGQTYFLSSASDEDRLDSVEWTALLSSPMRRFVAVAVLLSKSAKSGRCHGALAPRTNRRNKSFVLRS